jgi:hypothetical protein
VVRCPATDRESGPAPCRFLQPIPRSRDRTRRSIPRFAHERHEISKAVYQALPLCIVAALQGYAEAYATIIAYRTPTSGYWRKSALVAIVGVRSSWWPRSALQIRVPFLI